MNKKNGTEENPKKGQVEQGVGDIVLHLAKAESDPILAAQEIQTFGTDGKVDFCVINASNRFWS